MSTGEWVILFLVGIGGLAAIYTSTRAVTHASLAALNELHAAAAEERRTLRAAADAEKTKLEEYYQNKLREQRLTFEARQNRLEARVHELESQISILVPLAKSGSVTQITAGENVEIETLVGRDQKE